MPLRHNIFHMDFSLQLKTLQNAIREDLLQYVKHLYYVLQFTLMHEISTFKNSTYVFIVKRVLNENMKRCGQALEKLRSRKAWTYSYLDGLPRP